MTDWHSMTYGVTWHNWPIRAREQITRSRRKSAVVTDRCCASLNYKPACASAANYAWFKLPKKKKTYVLARHCNLDNKYLFFFLIYSFKSNLEKLCPSSVRTGQMGNKEEAGGNSRLVSTYSGLGVGATINQKQSTKSKRWAIVLQGMKRPIVIKINNYTQ